MSLPDRDGAAPVNRIFQDIGEFLAVATLECNQILRPAAHPRILFGRMVKNPTCFRLMQEGARKLDPTIRLVPAADDLAVFSAHERTQGRPRPHRGAIRPGRRCGLLRSLPFETDMRHF